MKFRSVFSFILILHLYGVALSEPPGGNDIDPIILRGIKLTITQQYDEAIATFDSLKQFSANDPRPYFYHAAAVQAKMLDYEVYDDEEQFLDLIKTTIAKAENWITVDSTRAPGFFFKGASYSYRGFYHAQRKNYLKGVRDAMIGIKFLEKAVQIDSSIYDAYLGIGSFYYWRSRLTEMLNWLPLFPDQRDEGLAMINKAIQQGRYGKDVAMNGLIWIEIDRKNYLTAVQLAQQMLKKYPDCRYYLWPLAEACSKAGLFDEAVKNYKKILKSFVREHVRSFHNEVVCNLKIARILVLQKNFIEARKAAETALKIEKMVTDKTRLRDKFDQLREIIRTCEAELSMPNSPDLQ